MCVSHISASVIVGEGEELKWNINMVLVRRRKLDCFEREAVFICVEKVSFYRFFF